MLKLQPTPPLCLAEQERRVSVTKQESINLELDLRRDTLAPPAPGEEGGQGMHEMKQRGASANASANGDGTGGAGGGEDRPKNVFWQILTCRCG